MRKDPNTENMLIGGSTYSKVTTFEEQDEHGMFVNYGKKDGLVAKEALGIGKYFTAQEIKINKLLQTIVDDSGGKQFIVEFVKETEDGRLVFERLLGNLEETPLLSPNELGQMIASITSGALFLDKLRIRHNDLHRIQNIFVSPEREFKIGDFNLAQLITDKSQQTGNLESICAMISAYVAEKVLNISDAVDQLVDVSEEIKKSNEIPETLKRIILNFLISTQEPIIKLRTLAKALLDYRGVSW